MRGHEIAVKGKKPFPVMYTWTLARVPSPCKTDCPQLWISFPNNFLRFGKTMEHLEENIKNMPK